MNSSAKRKALEEELKVLKHKRGRYLSGEQRLDILHAYKAIQLAALERHAKNPSRGTSKSDAQAKVIKLLGYSKQTVSSTYKDWNTSERVACRVAGGNYSKKKTRIPDTKGVLAHVRSFIQTRRSTAQLTTGIDVLDFLINSGFIDAPKATDSSDEGRAQRRAALRCTQMYLKRKGFQRGRRKKGFSYTEKAAISERRDVYLSALLENRARPLDQRLREVYLDETYIHHHYRRDQNSIYDPNDEQDLMLESRCTGQRYSFAAAIQGRDYSARFPNDLSAARIVPGSFWHFVDDSQKDHHKSFNADSFSKWFKEQLLANLTKPSLIIMDSASCHKAAPPDAPDPNSMKKAELLEFLSSKGVPMLPGEAVASLRVKARDWVASNVKDHCTLLAEERGHKVLYLPPHHSELQPIEMLWAKIKGDVGRQYNTNTTFAMVHERLLRAVDNASKDFALIERIIGHVDKAVERFASEDIPSGFAGLWDAEEHGYDEEITSETDETRCDSESALDDDEANSSSGSLYDDESII